MLFFFPADFPTVFGFLSEVKADLRCFVTPEEGGFGPGKHQKAIRPQGARHHHVFDRVSKCIA
jgi:hypothetical protein